MPKMSPYTIWYVRTLLYFGRLMGITFGGLFVSRFMNKEFVKSRISLNSNSFLKAVGIFGMFLISVSVVCNYAFVFGHYSGFFQQLAPFKKILFIGSGMLSGIESLLIVWALQRHGLLILDFLGNYQLNYKQFSTLILCLIFWFLFWFQSLASDLAYWLSEDVRGLWTNQSSFVANNPKLYVVFDILAYVSFYFSMLPSILSTIVQLNLSLVCYWMLVDLKRKYFQKKNLMGDFSRKNLVQEMVKSHVVSHGLAKDDVINNSFEVSKKNSAKPVNSLLEIRQKFAIIDKKLELLLTRFLSCAANLLFFVYLASSSCLYWIQLWQSILTGAILILFCFVHSLPHDISKRIVLEFDLMFNSTSFSDLTFVKNKLLF